MVRSRSQAVSQAVQIESRSTAILPGAWPAGRTSIHWQGSFPMSVEHDAPCLSPHAPFAVTAPVTAREGV